MDAKRLKGPSQCTNCRQVCQNKRSCKVPKASAPPKQGGRPPSNTQWAVAERSKKAERARKKVQNHALTLFVSFVVFVCWSKFYLCACCLFE